MLLIAFAFLAGAATALSPCVLPILPVVLAGGASGGKRRPLGIATGIVISFTFAVIALVYVIDALGLPGDLLRWIAIVTLGVFGVLLLVPPLADRVEAMISRLGMRPARVEGDGFWSGLVLGLSLGLVYAPCAGPILAGVITVTASQELTIDRIGVAVAYTLGSAVVLYGLMLGGRGLIARLRPAQGRVQMVTGVLMVAMALIMAGNLDLEFRNLISRELPSFVYNPTGSIESSDSVAGDLASLRTGGPASDEGGAGEAEEGSKLPDLGTAPELIAGGRWFNTADGEALSIAGLNAQGGVVLVDFWTYTCINCIRTLSHLKAWDERYRDQGLTIIGVHSPEFAFERDAGNVEAAIDADGIHYPVMQDNDFATWNAFGNQYWPAKYLIGADGEVRYAHFGEGDYEATEAAIRSLLAEAGHSGLGARARASTELADPGLGTPETYLGRDRALGWAQPLMAGSATYDAPPADDLELNEFAYDGRWRITGESATAVADASITARVRARRVFLVMGAPGGGTVDVELDGEPISAADAGPDAGNGTAQIREQRLYRLVDLPEAGDHTLTLHLSPGTTGYAFTFG